MRLGTSAGRDARRLAGGTPALLVDAGADARQCALAPMHLAVTILEDTADDAIASILALRADHDMVEVRAERWSSIPFAALRAATTKPLILTVRGRRIDPLTIEAAIAAGIDLVDAEYAGPADAVSLGRWRERIVLSLHDYEGMPEVEVLAAAMRGVGCAHTKLAVTPATLDDNLRLLRCVAPGTSVIGMGERGLYSRILAPFLGSEIAFVAPAGEQSAAPAQLDLDRALKIYGAKRAALHADHVFAIAGDPAGHSLSPAIHNPLFREKKVSAAYTIASFESFAETADALDRGHLRGVSVTAPFKEEALRFAERAGGEIGANARASGSANTLVQSRRGLVADNTDVDGFAALIASVPEGDGRNAAVIGAGGTARAAVVALSRAGFRTTVFNRTPQRGAALARELDCASAGLAALRLFDGDIVVNTLPGGVEVDLPSRPAAVVIEAAYADERDAARRERLRNAGVRVFDGVDLLHAQAVRQNAIFVRSLDGL